jgi:exonuclease VII small subunit
MNSTIENPLLANHDFELSARERAEYNRGIASSLDDAREDLDTIVSMLNRVDLTRSKFIDSLGHFKKGLESLEAVIEELEAV